MGKYLDGDEDSLTGIVKGLIKRIEKLEAGSRIGGTSIDQGSLWVKNGSLKVGPLPQIYFGYVSYGPDATPGWVFYRGDGTIAFALAGASENEQYWSLWDNNGNLILADDPGGQGFSKPYFPIPFSKHYNFTFDVNTTSATFTGLYATKYYHQHPKIRVDALMRTSDGTTAGEIQLLNISTGAVIAGPTTVAAGAFSIHTLGPAAVDADHLDYVEVEFQARRTAGAGNVGALIYGAYAVQN